LLKNNPIFEFSQAHQTDKFVRCERIAKLRILAKIKVKVKEKGSGFEEEILNFRYRSSRRLTKLFAGFKKRRYPADL